MFAWLRKEKWLHVKAFKIDRNNTYRTNVYYIHCFESDRGNRKIECVLDGEPYDIKKKDNWLVTTELYQMQIYRWLHGRRDPDIPTYEQTGEDDTANFLKGKVS